MKYKFFTVLAFMWIAYPSYCRNDTAHFARHLIYLEAAGIGGYGSLNYERALIKKKNWRIAMRAGLGTYRMKDFSNEFNPDMLLPLALHGYYGINHKVEWGVGQTFSSLVYADRPNFTPIRRTNLHTNFSIGYRYQKNAGGIMFRCAYTPLLQFNDNWRHWAGVSVGYTF